MPAFVWLIPLVFGLVLAALAAQLIHVLRYRRRFRRHTAALSSSAAPWDVEHVPSVSSPAWSGADGGYSVGTPSPASKELLFYQQLLWRANLDLHNHPLASAPPDASPGFPAAFAPSPQIAPLGRLPARPDPNPPDHSAEVAKGREDDKEVGVAADKAAVYKFRDKYASKLLSWGTRDNEDVNGGRWCRRCQVQPSEEESDVRQEQKEPTPTMPAAAAMAEDKKGAEPEAREEEPDEAFYTPPDSPTLHYSHATHAPFQR